MWFAAGIADFLTPSSGKSFQIFNFDGHIQNQASSIISMLSKWKFDKKLPHKNHDVFKIISSGCLYAVF
jgi:hypothetical protein